MNTTVKRWAALMGAVLCWSAATVSARALELPAVFADHMVLQRDVPVPVWGKAQPGDAVRVSLGDVHETATAASDGLWRVDLPAMPACAEPRTLEVAVTAGHGQGPPSPPVHFSDVLVGDVWHCGGQSNMSWRVMESNRAAAEIAAADHPQVRLFRVPHTSAAEPQFSSGGDWEVASPQTVGEWSAVGYFFARQIRASQGVPVGLVVTAWGGAAAEAYTPMQSLRADPLTRAYVEAYEKKRAAQRASKPEGFDPAALPKVHPDPGPTQASAAYVDRGFDDRGWIAVDLPSTIEATELGDIDGGVWFRRTLPLPAGFAGQPLQLNLGAIDDLDITYVNGQEVGRIGTETPNYYAKHREYAVPAERVTGDTITLAVRVFDHFDNGGFTSEARVLTLHPQGRPEDAVSLAGAWRMHADQPLSPSLLRGAHTVADLQHVPAALWNGMIHPVAPFAHRGVLWYQGETNAGRAGAYRTLLPMMIEDWRKLWNQPGAARNTPFLVVQLAGYQQPHQQPRNRDDWADLRDAQAFTAVSVPNVYVATAIDIGDAGDVHPRNKQDVGLRLARLAEHHVYGDASVVPVGPTLRQVDETVGELAVVTVCFDHAAGLTTTDGEAPRGFAIRTAGPKGLWRWAGARIVGQDVELTHPGGGQGPFEVRYAYGINPADGPQGINLVNGEGLPAMPFRTDPVPDLE